MSRKVWTADVHKNLAADLYDIRNVVLRALKHPLHATEGDRLAKTLNQIDALRSTLKDRALKEGHKEAAKHYYEHSGHPDEKENHEDNPTQEVLDEEARQEVVDDENGQITQDIIDEEARQEVLDDEAREIEQDIINEEEGE